MNMSSFPMIHTSCLTLHLARHSSNWLYPEVQSQTVSSTAAHIHPAMIWEATASSHLSAKICEVKHIFMGCCASACNSVLYTLPRLPTVAAFGRWKISINVRYRYQLQSLRVCQVLKKFIAIKLILKQKKKKQKQKMPNNYRKITVITKEATVECLDQTVSEF